MRQINLVEGKVVAPEGMKVGIGAAERGLQPAAAKTGKAGACHRPHLLYDREPCYRGKRARLLAGKGLSGGRVNCSPTGSLSGVTEMVLRKADFPQGYCKTAPVWGIL